jgi:hypothetical protein
MTTWNETQEADDFIATADSRETSPKIMEAIAFFARNKAEAESLWDGDGFGAVCTPLDLWENVTNNGQIDDTEFCWGAAGRQWWSHIQS